MENKNSFKVSIIVPAYNEQDNINPLLDSFDKMFQKANFNGEVIVVNDGSTDQTLEYLEKNQAKYDFLKILSHPINQGITASLESGFNKAEGDIFIYYPADLQYLPEDIPKLIDKMLEGYDIVTGWKQGNYGGKKAVSVIYNFLCRLFFKISVHDLNSVKAFKKEIFANIPLQKDWHRYMIVLAAAKGYKVGEVKITLYPRQHGKSKFNTNRILPAFWDFVAVLFVVKYSQKPMILFGNFGLITFSIGVLISVYLSILHFMGQKIGDRPLLLFAILLIFIGVQFFALGLLGELINKNNRKK